MNAQYRFEIIHITTVHARVDTRIRVKQVATLARVWPGQVALYVQDGKGDESDASDGFVIHDTGAPESRRLRRMTLGAFRMYRAVRRARPEIAHFHDPELIPVGLLLKFAGCKVIYDVHEDVPRQIKDKEWIPRILRWPLSWSMTAIEWLAARTLNAIVAAEPVVEARFPAGKTTLVQNFPKLEEFEDIGDADYHAREKLAVYVGGITELRGAREMVAAMAGQAPDVRLALGGKYDPFSLRDELATQDGWSHVIELGWLSRDKVVDLLGRARVGLVVLHPIGNYLEAYPVKMFEYMAAGLPVIASDFPLWRRIVEEAGCGLLVRPGDAQAFAEALKWLLDHPDEAAAMGLKGRKAVLEQYRWDNEAKKLISLYEIIYNSM